MNSHVSVVTVEKNGWKRGHGTADTNCKQITGRLYNTRCTFDPRSTSDRRSRRPIGWKKFSFGKFCRQVRIFSIFKSVLFLTDLLDHSYIRSAFACWISLKFYDTPSFHSYFDLNFRFLDIKEHSDIIENMLFYQFVNIW